MEKVRPDWLAQTTEAALEPELPIVDPHHHLWDLEGWGRYLADELVADLRAGHNVVGTVYCTEIAELDAVLRGAAIRRATPDDDYPALPG